MYVVRTINIQKYEPLIQVCFVFIYKPQWQLTFTLYITYGTLKCLQFEMKFIQPSNSWQLLGCTTDL